jgi:hypothetical protein
MDRLAAIVSLPFASASFGTQLHLALHRFDIRWSRYRFGFQLFRHPLSHRQDPALGFCLDEAILFSRAYKACIK